MAETDPGSGYDPGPPPPPPPYYPPPYFPPEDYPTYDNGGLPPFDIGQVVPYAGYNASYNPAPPPPPLVSNFYMPPQEIPTYGNGGLPPPFDIGQIVPFAGYNGRYNLVPPPPPPMPRYDMGQVVPIGYDSNATPNRYQDYRSLPDYLASEKNYAPTTLITYAPGFPGETRYANLRPDLSVPSSPDESRYQNLRTDFPVPSFMGARNYTGYPSPVYTVGAVPTSLGNTTTTLGPTHLIKFEGQWYDPNTQRFIQHEEAPLWQMIDRLASVRSTAKQALAQFLGETSGTGHLPAQLDFFDASVGRSLLTNFGGFGASKGDRGFKPEFKDDALYAFPWGMETPESKQLGHFITAVNMGLDGSTATKKEMIGHEQYSDLDPRSYVGGGYLSRFGLGNVSNEDVAAFNAALAYDLQGDSKSRDFWLSTIFDERRFGPQTDRRGNSMEDLRLSLKGWELGHMVASGQMKTNSEVADWIIRNVADWWY